MLKNRHLAFLFVFLIMFSFFQISNLDSNYSYGDDFAQYIMQSKALFDSSSNEYELQTKLNSYSPTQIGPNAYPIGYPVALKIIEVFSNGDFKYYKIVNIIFFSLYVLFSFLIISKKSKNFALLVSGLLLCSQEILNLSQSIESDLMFGLFCIISVYYLENKNNPFVAILIAFLSILIKVQGLIFLVLLTICIYQKNILNKFRIPFAIFLFSYLLVYLSPYRYFLGEYKDHFRQFSPYFLNFRYNLNILSESMLPQFIQNSLFNYFILLILIYTLMKTLLNLNSISIHNLLILGYFSFFSLYLNQQGIRFLLVLLPSIFILLFELLDFKSLKVNFGIYLIALLVIINLQFPLTVNLPNQAFNEESNSLYSYINNNIDEKKYIAAEKPRLIRLATGTNAVYIEEASILKSPDYLLISDVNLNKYNTKLESYTLNKKIGQFNLYELIRNK